MLTELEIAELDRDDALAAAFPLMAELRPRVRTEDFIPQVRAQQREGYRLLGGSVGGRYVTLAGYRMATTLVRGRHLFVDDLVTAATEQGKGYGTAMLRRLAEIAGAEGVERVCLDSRDTARTFYEHVGFTMHTSIPCYIDAAALQPRSGDRK
jgi:GNAT superfamily N-acetyltransferase